MVSLSGLSYAPSLPKHSFRGYINFDGIPGGTENFDGELFKIFPADFIGKGLSAALEIYLYFSHISRETTLVNPFHSPDLPLEHILKFAQVLWARKTGDNDLDKGRGPGARLEIFNDVVHHFFGNLGTRFF